jgi:hypothetical protein
MISKKINLDELNSLPAEGALFLEDEEFVPAENLKKRRLARLMIEVEEEFVFGIGSNKRLND